LKNFVIKMDEYCRSAYKRNRRRSFSCSDELWEKSINATKNCISVSEFIRQSIFERLK